MASYGSFVSACGFEHHGPLGTIGFAPKLSPDDFRCAFIAATGWGQFRQTRTHDAHRATIEIRWGQVGLTSVALEVREGWTPTKAIARVGETVLPCALSIESSRVRITLNQRVVISTGSSLSVELA
jgi:hypothetical protein